jgi:hypothetical protein
VAEGALRGGLFRRRYEGEDGEVGGQGGGPAEGGGQNLSNPT